MTETYLINFNVYGSGNGSLTGHMNVTFLSPDGSVTIGANQDNASISLFGRSVPADNEGIFRREDTMLLNRDHITRSVPVTEEQFYNIRDAAVSMGNPPRK